MSDRLHGGRGGVQNHTIISIHKLLHLSLYKDHTDNATDNLPQHEPMWAIICLFCSSFLCHLDTCGNQHKLSTHSLLTLLPIHSLYHPPHSHHSGTSPSGVWPLEGVQTELPTSVGYDHPEDWVGHGQYRTPPTIIHVRVVYNWAVYVCVQQLQQGRGKGNIRRHNSRSAFE